MNWSSQFKGLALMLRIYCYSICVNMGVTITDVLRYFHVLTEASLVNTVVQIMLQSKTRNSSQNHFISSGIVPGIFISGAIAQGVWGHKSPSGVKGQSSLELKQLQTLFADFDCRNDQNLTILLKFVLTSMFSIGVGAERHLGAKPPSPC